MKRIECWFECVECMKRAEMLFDKGDDEAANIVTSECQFSIGYTGVSPTISSSHLQEWLEIHKKHGDIIMAGDGK